MRETRLSLSSQVIICSRTVCCISKEKGVASILRLALSLGLAWRVASHGTWASSSRPPYLQLVCNISVSVPSAKHVAICKISRSSWKSSNYYCHVEERKPFTFFPTQRPPPSKKTKQTHPPNCRHFSGHFFFWSVKCELLLVVKAVAVAAVLVSIMVALSDCWQTYKASGRNAIHPKRATWSHTNAKPPSSFSFLRVS